MDAPSQSSSRRAELGQFLKARRARVSPDEAAVTPFGGSLRRVPGLRREELAQLAGVSADYYVRLEQGRGGNASRAVLDAIATALQLDDSERAYIHELAAPAIRRRRPSAPQRVSTAARALLDALTDVPAYLTGPRTEILAWNPPAAALFVEFGALPPAQRNWARLVFLDPAMRELFTDWTSKARDTVAYLRFSAGRHRDDPQLAALVGELSLHSPEFRKLWSEHRVRDKTAGTKTLHHPIVGHLELSYSTWRASDNPDQVLIAYTPANAQAQSTLRLLTTWTAPSNDDTARRNTQTAAES